jgi:deoxyribonuclease-4
MASGKSRSSPLIGAHMSISGGVDQAPLRGKAVGCVCIQVFTKSNMQWAARPLQAPEIAAFHRNCAENGIGPVMAHNCYLINLGAADEALAKKSFDSFLMEVERCRALDLPGLIAHPGSHVGSGEEAGIRRIAAAVNGLIEKSPGAKVKILLETTAGQGTNLGYRFEQLAQMIAAVKDQSRVGVCYDTCHTFAAGYDIRTEDAYRRTMEEFDKILGLRRICAFHFNDSKGDFGSRLDRHEHIGLGKIGKDAFGFILRDQRFKNIPKILETPKGKKGKEEWDVVNLRVLRQLAEK